MKKKIELSRERRQELVRALQAHFAEVHDEEIGDLKAGLLLDFVIQKLGPALYNQGVLAAQGYLQEKLLDLEVDVLETERER